jgi:hypothetical protein
MTILGCKDSAEDPHEARLGAFWESEGKIGDVNHMNGCWLAGVRWNTFSKVRCRVGLQISCRVGFKTMRRQSPQSQAFASCNFFLAEVQCGNEVNSIRNES